MDPNERACENALAMRRLVLVLLVFCTACRTATDIQRDYAHHLAPSAFKPESSPAPSTPVEHRKLRVRAYLDDDFRSQVLHPEDRVRRQFERASEVLGSAFGVELVVVELKPWTHTGRGALAESAEALEKLDPGTDVDWVVGFTSALPVFSGTMDQLGMARVYGRHAVLRGMENPEEHDAIERVLDKLSEHERETLYRELQLHKETAVMLHEWGHSLGAWHTRDPDFLMHESYDRHQTSFADESVDAITVGLQHYPAGTELRSAERKAWAEELQKLATTRGDQWRDQGREQVARFNDPGNASTQTTRRTPFSRDEVDQYKRAAAAYDAHDYLKSRALLAPLNAKYPDDPDVAGLGCLMAASEPSPGPEVLGQCRRAAALPGQTQRAGLLFTIGRLQAQSKDIPGALTSYVEAKTILASSTSPDLRDWKLLAQGFAHAHALTAAEDALTNSKTDDEELRSRITAERRWVGVPRKDGIEPEKEAELVAALMAAQKDIDEHRKDRARDRIKNLLKDHPDSPGALSLHCAERGLSGDLKAAMKACEAAVKIQDDCLQAEFMLAQMDRKTEQQRLEKIVAIDPSFETGWKRLGVVYSSSGQKGRAAELKAQYKAKFGKDLVF